MTINEFLVKVREARRNWRLCGNDQAIRAFSDSSLWLMCPITAVCLMETGELYQMTCFGAAAERLGLDQHDAYAIAGAADFPYQPHGNELRNKLLAAAGL